MAKVFLDKEYIEKEAALEIIQSISPPSWDAISRTAAYCEIKYLSPADVKPVVRGRWVDKERHEHYPSGKPYTARYCGVCGKRDHNEDGDFCGYCGADMRKEGEDEIN